MYEEARRNEQRLLAELDTAREIQRQLLPRGAREVRDWTSQLLTFPRANSAVTSTIFFPTGTAA